MLVANILAGNAQFFVEGGLSFDKTEEKTDDAGVDFFSSSDRLMFGFSSQAGYWLNDNFAVGTILAVSQSKTEGKTIYSNNPQNNNNSNRKFFRWQISAFSRYKLWGSEKFSVLLDGSLYFAKTNGKSTVEQPLSITKSSPVNLETGIKAIPVVTYDLNERLSIKVTCSFLSMNLYYLSGKTEYSQYTVFDHGLELSDGNKTKNMQNGFSFGTEGELGNIQIGIIYKFDNNNKKKNNK